MNSSKIFRNLILTASLFLCCVALSACELIEGTTQQQAVLPTVIVPTPVDTPEPDQVEAVVANAEEGSVRDSSRAITIWVLPEQSIDVESPEGALFAQQIADFESSHPDLDLSVEQKGIIGQGSMLDYFSSASVVAPNILPDLVLIPDDMLPRFVEAGIVTPLDELISEQDLADLYPVIDEITVFDNQRMGYPHSLSGLTHAAYNSAVYSSTLPSRLDQLFDLPLKPSFPATSQEGADLLFQLYLDEGGQIYNEEGAIAFESTPLLVGLRRIQALRNSETIARNSSEIANREEMWIDYKSGNSSLILTTSDRFLVEYQETSNLSFGQFPGSINGITPMVDGWVWAVTTADPVRQALAVELISWLANGSNMGSTTVLSERLPARSGAFEFWPNPDDEYIIFLDSELNRAIQRPELLDSNVGSVLQDAMLTLFSTTNPDVPPIAERATESINGN